MKTIRDPSQQRLFDPFEGVISETGRRKIDGGWQSLFREVILEQLPVERFSKGMSENLGRPGSELYSMLGLLLIRDLKDWTVEATHDAVLFRADIQYALNLEPGFEVSQRTIERYLQVLQNDEELGEEIFARVTDTLLKSMEVKVKKQRLDSTHVLSDMALLGRVRMIGVALRRFFHKLEKHDASLLERFDEKLLRRYRKPSDSGVFGDVRTADERRAALQQVADDLYAVLNSLATVEPVCNWDSFQQLELIFSQQCEVREEFVEVLKKTGGNVIQNVSDSDATYCGNKGPGYQVQLSETFNEDGLPNLITSARVETAVQSDAEAVSPILEDLEQRNALPNEMLADAGYGSDDNVELAAKNGVTLTAPVPGGKKFDPDEVGYDQFELNEANEVVACPAGHAPKSSNYNPKTKNVTARMDPSVCQACSLLAFCPVQRKKKKSDSDAEPKANGRVQFRRDAPRAAQRRRREQTEEFRELYRWRAGIEATNGTLKRMLGLNRLRVRGWKAVKTAILLKLAGWNILRGAALRAERNRQAEVALI